jgi:vanillate monooxygenase ferredoxin subunit
VVCVWTSHVIDVVVKRKRMEADDICSLELAACDGGRLPSFSPGAHIDVRVTPDIVRQYSLCNSPDENDRYLIAVLRESNSRGGSTAIHEQIREGSSLQIGEPRNHFPLAHDAKCSILLAGGIGITPILSMAQQLSAVGAHLQMHYCARSRSRAAFYDRILRSPFGKLTHFHFADGSADQSLNIPAVLGSPHNETHAYVCGPGGFMNHIRDAALKLNWPESRLHREYFAAPPIDGEAATERFEIKIASTGKTISVGPNQSVVMALAAHGIKIPVSCEAGVCGTCMTGVIQGTPDHRDVFMSREEHSRNDRFTPCCSRSKTPILVLDL